MLAEMESLVDAVSPEVTFAIRAGYVGKSLGGVLRIALLKARYSVTLWHNKVDEVTKEGYLKPLEELRLSLPKNRVLYDLPEDVIDFLRNVK